MIEKKNPWFRCSKKLFNEIKKDIQNGEKVYLKNRNGEFVDVKSVKELKRVAEIRRKKSERMIKHEECPL